MYDVYTQKKVLKQLEVESRTQIRGWGQRDKKDRGRKWLKENNKINGDKDKRKKGKREGRLMKERRTEAFKK